MQDIENKKMQADHEVETSIQKGNRNATVERGVESILWGRCLGDRCSVSEY